MENQATAIPPAAEPAKRHTILDRVLENPVIHKELRGRMRGRQAFLLLTLYLMMISIVIGTVYSGLTSSMPYSGGDIEARQTAGKVIFGTVVLLELFLISFIGPALTAGAITSERERQTFDLLRTTTLPARSLVVGKLVSSLAYLLLLVFAALPIESIAFLLGGVGLEEIIISTLMMIVTAVFFCSLGMLFSSLLRRTLAATVASYASIILSFIVLALAFFLMAAFSPSLSSLSTNTLQRLVTIVIWIVVCTNPMLAAGVSEAILISDQSVFMTKTSPFGGTNLALPSPWIPFVIIYTVAAIMMIAISVRAVRRTDR